MKLNINNVIFEITRECNLNCDHCLRGEKQDLDLSYDYIDSFFKQVDNINSFSISGGEPGLHPEIIQYIIQSAKKHNVDIDSYYLATNGTISSDKFILSLIDMYLYCSDNEITGVSISNDQYHKVDKIILNNNIERLSCLSFVHKMFKDDNYYKTNILCEGNAENLNIKYQEYYMSEYEIEKYNNTLEIVEGEIYLNCNGDIIQSCDLSYKNQDKHIICDVDDLKETFFKMYKGAIKDEL